MSDIPATQKAVLLTGSRTVGELVSVGTIPTPSGELSGDEIIIKTESLAANPTDWKHAVFGLGDKGNVSGSDGAGVIAKVGPEVKDLKVGDAVSFVVHGGYHEVPTRGAFQEYVKTEETHALKYSSLKHTSAKTIPPGKIDTFEAAATINVAVATIGLGFGHYLKLDVDSDNSQHTVLVWGGATTTGFLAVQAAKKVFGLKVVATASKKHTETLKKAGADAVFDYHDADVVDQIKAYAGESLIYVFDTVGTDDAYVPAYKALTTAHPGHINTLLSGSKDTITAAGESPRSDVTYSNTLAYLIAEESVDFHGPAPITGSPEVRADGQKFWKLLGKYVNDGTIQNAPVTVLDGGFSAAEKAFTLLASDKVSLEKLVFEAK